MHPAFATAHGRGVQVVVDETDAHVLGQRATVERVVSIGEPATLTTDARDVSPSPHRQQADEERAEHRPARRPPTSVKPSAVAYACANAPKPFSAQLRKMDPDHASPPRSTTAGASPCSSRVRRRGHSIRGRARPRWEAGICLANTPSWTIWAAERIAAMQAKHRMDLPGPAEDVDRARREDERADRARGGAGSRPVRSRASSGCTASMNVRAARRRRTVQLRLAGARVVVDRDLATRSSRRNALKTISDANSIPVEWRSRIGQRVAAHGAHPAVGVGDLHSEEHVEHAREDRVADAAVEPRHRIVVDRALRTASR